MAISTWAAAVDDRVTPCAGTVCIALPILAALALTWASAPTLAADAVALEGAWTALSARRAGQQAPELVGHVLTLEADRFTIARDGKVLYGGPVAVDVNAEPARIEFHQEQGADLRGTWLGIWRIEGDRLTVCDNAPDMTRPAPADFAVCEKPGYVVVEFGR